MESEIIEDAEKEALDFWESGIKDWYKEPDDAKMYAKAFAEKLLSIVEEQ